MAGSEEDAFEAACREFEEELGLRAEGDFIPLVPIRQRGGKAVRAWGVEGDLDPAHLHSNEFTMEWPPKSGQMQRFPEVDRAAWFTLEDARTRINAAQMPLLEELSRKLAEPPSS